MFIKASPAPSLVSLSLDLVSSEHFHHATLAHSAMQCERTKTTFTFERRLWKGSFSFSMRSSHSNSNGALLFLSLCVDLLALRLDTHSSLFCFFFFVIFLWPFIFSQNMCPQSPSFAGNTFELMDSFPESLNYSLCYQFSNKSLKNLERAFVFCMFPVFLIFLWLSPPHPV